jgi:hypothetical protein
LKFNSNILSASFLSTHLKKISGTQSVPLIFLEATPLRCEASHLCDGSNLKAKRKRLSIVFATLFAAKQGADISEQAQAIGCDYATGADVT